MNTIRLTMAQALTRFLAAQKTEIDGKVVPYFGGVWAIFGHGNVAGLGEALHAMGDDLPTFRAHNEQSMAHSAIAYAKKNFRRRAMAVTTSIGPGATNMVTAAALAHVNRLPLLLLPGDIFANRRPDPVLQQVESFADGTVSANDCFRPVSRYFDRITRPEQLISALARTMAVLTDPADCGPVTLGLCQDVQAEAYDYPVEFFAEKLWTIRRPRPSENELSVAVAALKSAKNPLIIAGGGVLFSQASAELKAFAEKHGIPVSETQAGKSSLPGAHPLNVGPIGVTGSSSANALAADADVILAIGSRLQDFTTGSWSLLGRPSTKLIGLNIQHFDAMKRRALPLVADAKAGIKELSAALGNYKSSDSWLAKADALRDDWFKAVANATKPTNRILPSDSEVIGVVQRVIGSAATMVGAAGGLPGELHKLWQAGDAGSYHMEYGFSCMGYEIAGGIGVKMAKPEQDVVVMLGDGSYLMANSEIATSVMLGLKLTIVLLDNRGFGCINRLQMATGGANFNNLLKDARHVTMPNIDFAMHAAALGAVSSKVSSLAELEEALKKSKDNPGTTVVVIDTDPLITTKEGGTWWEVAVPEVSVREAVRKARADYEAAIKNQNLVN